MNHDEALLLCVFSLGAFFIPLLSRRLSLPSAVGEICFGLVLGFAVSGIPEAMPTIKFLSELGFLLLMYLAGLEIDFPAIKSTGKKNLFPYLLFFLLLGVGSWLATRWLDQQPLYGLLYFITTVGLLFPVLKESGLLQQSCGQRLLILGSLGEVFSLLGLTLFILYSRFGLSLKTLASLAEIAGFFGLCYLIAKLFRLFVWWHPKKIGVFLQTGDSSETGVRANLVNLFLFVSLAALFDIERIIGAFFGGMLFALVFARREEIKEKLGAFGYGFLIPLFFIEVGLRFNLRDFFSGLVLWQALLLCVVILLVRAFACLSLVFSHFSRRELALVPVGLSFPLTLLVALAAVGLQENILSRQEGTVIVLTAVLTALVYPWIFKLLLTVLKKNTSATL
jgi:Kef-type K+ transport system membrane component KefB